MRTLLHKASPSFWTAIVKMRHDLDLERAKYIDANSVFNGDDSDWVRSIIRARQQWDDEHQMTAHDTAIIEAELFGRSLDGSVTGTPS